MILRHFLAWSGRAAAAQRAEGAGELARAYLYADLDAGERREAEIALMSLLDDPSPLVRRALADNMASAEEAPVALILALACDQPDIAAPVLSRSPLLTDADLIDCAALGDSVAQRAIARRARAPAAVCATIAEIGGREAALALAENPGAEIPEFALRRMIARFGDDGEIREALLARPHLPPSVRNDLVTAAAASLAAFVVDCGWLSTERAERLTREERDKANVVIAVDVANADADTDVNDRRDLRDLVAHLAASGQLTTSLLLRALLTGDRALVVAAFAELSGLRESRIENLLRDARGAGFAALYARAGLPEKYRIAFCAALAAQQDKVGDDARPGALSTALIERARDACEAARAGAEVIALLHRFEREAARDGARRETARLAAEAMTAPAVFSGVSAAAPLIDLAALEAELLAA